MTAITTSRPMSHEFAPVGESLGHRWLKNILTAALAGILCLVLIGVTRTASALIARAYEHAIAGEDVTALQLIGSGSGVGGRFNEDDACRSVCRSCNACEFRLRADDDRVLCIVQIFIGILHPAVHALDEIESGNACIDLRRVNRSAVLLLLLRVVGGITEAFVHDIGEIHEIAERVPVVPRVEVGSDG